jgi:hypothetical protein
MPNNVNSKYSQKDKIIVMWITEFPNLDATEY